MTRSSSFFYLVVALEGIAIHAPQRTSVPTPPVTITIPGHSEHITGVFGHKATSHPAGCCRQHRYSKPADDGERQRNCHQRSIKFVTTGELKAGHDHAQDDAEIPDGLVTCEGCYTGFETIGVAAIFGLQQTIEDKMRRPSQKRLAWKIAISGNNRNIHPEAATR